MLSLPTTRGSALLLLLLSTISPIHAQDVSQDALEVGLNEPSPPNPSPGPTSETLKLYHRFTYPAPSSPTPEWVERGEIVIDLSDDTTTFTQHSRAWEGVQTPAELDEQDAEGLGGVRYEVSVRKGERGHDESSFVSIESCQLFSTISGSTLSESLVLHSSPNSHAFSGFNYQTIGSNACGLSDSERKEVKFGLEKKEGPEGKLNVRVQRGFVMPTPVLPQQVELKTPVQIDKDGKVVPPPKPKSFIQKYWMYIVPVLVFLLMGGGADDGDAKSGKKK